MIQALIHPHTHIHIMMMMMMWFTRHLCMIIPPHHSYSTLPCLYDLISGRGFNKTIQPGLSYNIAVAPCHFVHYFLPCRVSAPLQNMQCGVFRKYYLGLIGHSTKYAGYVSSYCYIACWIVTTASYIYSQNHIASLRMHILTVI